MKLKITSFRGHHECDVPQNVGKSLFEKLTGRSSQPLSETLRTEIPATFGELEALWRNGPMGYSAFSVGADKQFESIKDFDSSTGEIVFIAPIVGG